MGRPYPEKGLHANRPYSTPWSSQGRTGCFSGNDFLTDKMNTAFATGQSMNVGSDGENKNDPETWPGDWPKVGSLLRVPKCVILSTLPNWCDWWPDGYFNGPRDVIGTDGLGALVNYYYLEQWNNTTDDAGGDTQGGAFTPDSSFFNNFDKANSSTDSRRPSKEIYSDYYNDMINDEDATGPNNIAPALTPPSERFYQVVGSVTNPYYKQHAALLTAFKQAKKILEKDHNIWCLVPEWMRPKLYQIRNFFLTKNRTKRNAAHGGSDNGRDCAVTDIEPCYTTPEVAWGPSYPDVKNPKNYLDFNANGFPALTSTDPGFGTNMLHLYVGHPVVRYFPGNDPWTYQAWPLTPEVQFLGPVLLTVYISQSDLTPFFNGRRNLWVAGGLDYGFLHHGALGVYNFYKALYASAAGEFKENFWKYRNFTTKWFTYSEKWQFSWNLDRIREDRRNDCAATLFYFGHEFGEFASTYDTTDNSIEDCADSPANPASLKYGDTHNFFPSEASIDYAITVSLPLITQKIEAYYNGLEPGCADLYQMIIDQNGLADYNVSYEGDCGPISDAGSIVDYVLAYFKDNP